MDLRASTRARIVRELFCTFAACRTPLLHHSLRNLGDVSRALHSDFRCRLQRLSLGRVAACRTPLLRQDYVENGEEEECGKLRTYKIALVRCEHEQKPPNPFST